MQTADMDLTRSDRGNAHTAGQEAAGPQYQFPQLQPQEYRTQQPFQQYEGTQQQQHQFVHDGGGFSALPSSSLLLSNPPQFQMPQSQSSPTDTLSPSLIMNTMRSQWQQQQNPHPGSPEFALSLSPLSLGPASRAQQQQQDSRMFGQQQQQQHNPPTQQEFHTSASNVTSSPLLPMPQNQPAAAPTFGHATFSAAGGMAAATGQQQGQQRTWSFPAVAAPSLMSHNPLLKAQHKLQVSVDEMPISREEREGADRFDKRAIETGAQRYLDAEDALRSLDEQYDKDAKQLKQAMTNNQLFIKLYLRQCLDNQTPVGLDGDQERLTVKEQKGRIDRPHIIQCAANTLMYVTCDKCAAYSKRAREAAVAAIQQGAKTPADFQPQDQFPEIYDNRYAYTFDPQKALATSMAIADVVETTLQVEHKVVVQRIPAAGTGHRRPKRRDAEIVVTVPPERL